MSTPSPRPTPPSRPERPQRSRVPQLWSALSTAQRRTAAAAVVVLGSLATPWYSTEVVFRAPANERAPVAHGSLSGFAAFSFVEAAVLLTAVAVLALTWARATRRSFSLPGRDGTVVTVAAGWIGVLIVYRMFARPDGSATVNSNTLIGLSWGIFASLAAVGLLLATGLAQRRAVPSRRASAAARAEGPVVDPADIVPADVLEHDGGWTPGAVRSRASDGRPRERRAEADAPAGPPARRPDRSPRRPAGHEDATRALGRDDAAALLRDAGLGHDGPASSEGATRAVPRDAADDATRAVPRDPAEDATRAVPRDPAEDATRAVPRDPAEDATRAVPRDPAEDATRAVPRDPAEDATRAVRHEDADATWVRPARDAEDATRVQPQQDPRDPRSRRPRDER